MTTELSDHQISCRRCGRGYVLGRSMILPACPHCGKAPVPLHRRLRHNGLAAVLCVLAIITLGIAINLPFISMSKLGEARTFTLLSGIVELFNTGQPLIGVILFVFSVIFPFAKLLAILIATSALLPISLATRHRLHQLATVTGKYSLLDILVVAIVIVLVKFKGLAEAHAQLGTTLFCVAIFLSILAGFAVKLDTENLDGDKLDVDKLDGEELNANNLDAATLNSAKINPVQLDTVHLDNGKLSAGKLNAVKLNAVKLNDAKRHAAKLDTEKLTTVPEEK